MEGVHHNYIDFKPTPGTGNDDFGFILGTVTDMASHPIEAVVTALGKFDRNSDGTPPSVGGFYRMALGVGKYYLYAEATNYHTQVYPESVEVKNLDTTIANFTLTGVGEQNLPAYTTPQFSVIPFKNDTKITFQLPGPMDAKVTVFDGSGRLVKVLFNGRADNRLHTVYWDGRNQQGKTMPAGLYFVTLEAEKSMVTKKLVVVR
jgi:hypothetical protein